MTKDRIAIFFGGMSSEHDISCLSAATVAEGIDKTKHELLLVGITKEGRWLRVRDAGQIRDGSWRRETETALLLPAAVGGGLLLTDASGASRRERIDAAFPVLHGRFGEDGTIQGLFELARLPYVGCGVAASAVSMDKLYTKVLVEQLGIAQAEYVGLTREELKDMPAARQKVEAALAYPIFVKPCDGGSSQGVSRVDRREKLEAALRHAASEGTRVMAERAISGREIECAVLTASGETKVSGVGEILAAAEFYDFDAKYTNPASETDLHPAFPVGKEEEVRRAAKRIFSAVGGYGLARVDFFLEKGTDRVIFNEINTMPGFTSISMYPKLWEAAGLPLPRLLDILIEGAYRR